MKKKKVLFFCKHNACRSQMAEALLRRIAGDRFDVFSAGLYPRPIHPLVHTVMEERAWKTYLADRFNLNADTVTVETIVPELEKQNLDSDLMQAIHDRFARQDTTSYAPPGTPANKSPSARDLVRKIEKALCTQTDCGRKG